MAKKSRKTAARYSELSKAGKKRQRDTRRTVESKTVSARAADMADSSMMEGRVPDAMPKAQPVSKPQPVLKHSLSSYQHIKADLKRIGTLTAAIIVILIILSFVLD